MTPYEFDVSVAHGIFRPFVRAMTILIAACSSTSSSSEPLVTDASDAGATPEAAVDAPREAAPIDASTIGSPCTDQRTCDDGIFCNGVEECLAGVCISARNAACRDSGGCATSLCIEASDSCEVTLSGGAVMCGSGTICSAGTGCESVDGCTTANDPKCDDGRACTADSCDVASGACVHLPVNASCPASVGACGVGVCVGRDTDDPSGCGALEDASKCAMNQGCDDTFACSALPASCATDHDCNDGTLCDGVERCVSGACVHGDRTRCEASDACHQVECASRALGDPYCLDVPIFGCK